MLKRGTSFTKATTQFHIIRKLNPMNSPSTPPMSATKETKGKEYSSLITCTVDDVKNRSKFVDGVGEGAT